MTTITTGTQGPQIRLIVLIGIALAAIGVAAMIAVNRPTTTTNTAQDAPAESQVITDTGATDRIAPLPDSLADAQDRAMAQARIDDREAAASSNGEPVADAVLGTTLGATDRIAPLPDSLADAQDRAMAQARIADREAAASSYGEPVADAVLGDSNSGSDGLLEGVTRQAVANEQAIIEGARPGFIATTPVDALTDGIIRSAAAQEQAIGEGARPGVVNTSAVDAQVDGITRRASAYEQAVNDGGVLGYNAPAGAAPLPEATTVVDPADMRFFTYFNGASNGTTDEPVRWDDNPADIKFLNGYIDDTSRAEPVQDWQWPMPNEQIL